MVFSKEDKIIIQNDYEEKGWSANKIWKDHSSKNWTYTSVKRHPYTSVLKVVNRKGSGQPRSVTTKENTNLRTDLFTRRSSTHKHIAPRKIAKQTGISHLSIRRMIKRRNFHQFKRVKTPEMQDGCHNRRYARAIALAEKFERNTHMIEKNSMTR